jgi:hypothetical protein
MRKKKCEREMKMQNFQMFESSSIVACFDQISRCQCNRVLSVSISRCQCNRRMMST